MSLAFVVKEGEFYCHIFLKFEEEFSQREITVRGRIVFVLHYKDKDLFSNFISAMTCCVAINAKEGDCWIQLVNCMVVFDVTQMS